MDSKTNTVGYLSGFEVWRKIGGNSWWGRGGGDKRAVVRVIYISLSIHKYVHATAEIQAPQAWI
jgi:hypothetical protein